MATTATADETVERDTTIRDLVNAARLAAILRAGTR